jgi:hypothetical protein
VLTETLSFLATSIQDFGLAAFDVPALLTWAKADLGSSVAGTRTAATAMVRPHAAAARRGSKPAPAAAAAETTSKPRERPWRPPLRRL